MRTRAYKKRCGVRGRPLVLELTPQLPREHPAETGEKVRAVERLWIAHKALFAIVVPRRHAVKRRIRAQDGQRRLEIGEKVGRNIKVIWKKNKRAASN